MTTKQIANEILLPETARLIAEGHTVTHIVRGNSMNPFLVDRRDKVILSSFANSDIRKGSFVLAKDAIDRFVLHRVIQRKGDALLLMGDGNIKETERSSIDRILGVVTTVIRKDRPYSCDGCRWRVYTAAWMFLLPVRRILLGVWRRGHL